MPPPSWRQAGADDLDFVRALFGEYQAGLGIDLGFQGFEEELVSLPHPYEAIYLAAREASTLGCVAIKPLEDGVCELKRLYVRPIGRGQGLGRALCERAMLEAARRGYRTMRLDTLARLTGAISLYRALGFVEVAPYHDAVPDEPLVFMERGLVEPPSRRLP